MQSSACAAGRTQCIGFLRPGTSGRRTAARKIDCGGAHAASPEYPLVIRVDHTELELLAANQVDEWGRVDQVVLGTHAVGKSHAQGAISVLMVPDRNDASFDVIFQGRTHTTTVGTHGPALICSHTDTDFVCTRPITFHARQGFVAANCKIVAHTNVTYDGFGSSHGRLGHRLISRIARRRRGESREQVRQIAARINEAALVKAFDKRLDAQLATMNQKMNLAQYVNLFAGRLLCNSRPIVEGLHLDRRRPEEVPCN